MSAKTALGLYTSFIVAVFILAYLNLLPLELIKVKWFDSLGHFVLYGLWGYLFGRAYPNTILSFGSFAISTGILTCTLIAIIEECLQSLSPYRSFTLSDMAFSIAGILVAAIYLNTVKQKKLI